MKRSVCSCTDYTCTCGRTDGPGEKKGRRAPFVDRTNAAPQPPQAGRYTGWTVPVYTHPSLRHLLKHLLDAFRVRVHFQRLLWQLLQPRPPLS